jgi:C1A family cysteine protease
MRFLIAALLVASATALVVTSANVDAVFKFQSWASKYAKTYETDADYDHAFHNFQASLARIAKRQQRKSATVWGLTKFSDLSPAEFKAQYLTANLQGWAAQNFTVAKPSTKAAPTKFDWSSKTATPRGAATTPVKDQQQCGSCWAFSATESMESQWFLGGKPMVTLGPQQLVDCDPQSQGCNGGWTYWAFQYLMTVGGQETETAYPYTAQTGTCAYDAASVAVGPVKGFTYAIPNCESGACTDQGKYEETMKNNLAATGPFSICVNAGSWSDYSSGVLEGADCDGNSADLDHCVQVVGYNWQEGWWKVRNSWNTNWGEAGFIRLQVGQNTCGLADVVTYPLF